MNSQRRDAAERLALVLAQENDLLERFNYPGIGLGCEAKRLALATFENSPAEPGEPDGEADKELAARLAGLVQQNKNLLERALRIQSKIMGIVAGAARRSGESTLYGSGGHRSRTTGNRAVALITRA